MAENAAKKLPTWAIQILVWLLSMAFVAGGAYATFAPKTWVTEQIQAHEVSSETRHREEMKEIKEILKRIDDRLYDQVKEQAKKQK